MKTKLKYLFTIAFAGLYFYSPAQQLSYSAEESKAIHESIEKSRWDIGGKLSQYSFRYMSEFFPTAIIHKAETPYRFQIKPKKSIEDLKIKFQTENLPLEEYLKKLHIASFIVIDKGSIVYEKYFSMLPEDQHTLQSVNKVITSTLITSLINQKKIDFNKTIEIYLPELKGSNWQGISVKDILNMRSGMDSKSIDFESGPFTNPLHKNYQLESALGILPSVENTPKSVYEFIKNMKKDNAPGVAAEYSNINTFVLGWLAEKVTGKKYSDLVTSLIWQPMGASSNAYVCQSPNGIAWTHGGISATLRDLARFGMLYTKSEIKLKKESLISIAQLKEIFDTPPIDFVLPFKWGYQWDFANDGVLMKGGFGGQALHIDPENEIVIAYFNYVDEDWNMNNIISDAAVNDIIKTAKSSK